MERKICPYLGLHDDHKTRMAFPSEGNYCYKAFPPDQVSREHQSAFCLSGQHNACPVFLALAQAGNTGKTTAVLPAIDRRYKRLRDAVVLAIGIILWLGGAWTHGSNLVSGMVLLGGPLVQPRTFRPDTAPDRYPYPQVGPSAQPLDRGSILIGPDGQTGHNNTTDCPPPPQGWTSIIVQPTDSIYRLSILHGASVEEIQAANCLGSETYLAHGMTLHVPGITTATQLSVYLPTGFARLPSRGSTANPVDDSEPAVQSPAVDSSNPILDSSKPPALTNQPDEKKEDREEGKGKKGDKKDEDKKDDDEDKDEDDEDKDDDDDKKDDD